MLVKDGCNNHDASNSKLEKYRMENERTMRTESVNAERQRSRVRSRVKCLNGTESR